MVIRLAVCDVRSLGWSSAVVCIDFEALLTNIRNGPCLAPWSAYLDSEKSAKHQHAAARHPKTRLPPVDCHRSSY